MKYKLTIGIKKTVTANKKLPPIFIEGEQPGVFATQEFEIEEPLPSTIQMAKWSIVEENILANKTIEFKWKEL
jgi:hypothetical protein